MHKNLYISDMIATMLPYLKFLSFKFKIRKIFISSKNLECCPRRNSDCWASISNSDYQPLKINQGFFPSQNLVSLNGNCNRYIIISQIYIKLFRIYCLAVIIWLSVKLVKRVCHVVKVEIEIYCYPTPAAFPIVICSE